MKLKKGFILNEVAGECIVIPGDADLDFHGMITLNSTGRFLWQLLDAEHTEDELLSALLEKYDINEAEARLDVQEFIKTLKERGFLE